MVVVDLQTGMFDGVLESPLHDAVDLAARVRALLAWARRTRRKVAFVRHDGPQGDPLAPGQGGWPVWHELGQTADEPTFSKCVGNAFSNPAFGEWVAQQGAGELIVLGAQSEYCIAATVSGALDAGLRVTVVVDAHSTRDGDGETAERIVARCNAEFEAAGAALVSTHSLTGA